MFTCIIWHAVQYLLVVSTENYSVVKTSSESLFILLEFLLQVLATEFLSPSLLVFLFDLLSELTSTVRYYGTYFYLQIANTKLLSTDYSYYCLCQFTY